MCKHFMIVKTTAEWKNIVKRYSTPLYYYDGDTIVDRYRRLRQIYPGSVDIYYAFKSNNSLAICQLLQKEGAGADITSLGEYILAKRAGFHPSRLLFTGPGKRIEELDVVIKEEIGMIVAESLTEIKRIDAIARKYNKKQKVLLRINVNYCTTESGIQLGGGCQKFGVDEQNAALTIKEILKKKNITFLGIHAISGSLILKYSVLLKAYSYAIKLADKLMKQNIPIRLVDFGGGLGIPYTQKQEPINLVKLGAGVKKMLIGKSYQGIVEIGRFLVGEPGVYITKVIDTKESGGKKFAVLDGGTHHILRQYLQWANAFVDVMCQNDIQTDKKEHISLGGPLCTPSDFLVRDTLLPAINIDDLLIFQNCGAYAYSTGIALFSGHPTPIEVMEYDGRIMTIRSRGNADDILRRQHPIAKE